MKFSGTKQLVTPYIVDMKRASLRRLFFIAVKWIQSIKN